MNTVWLLVWLIVGVSVLTLVLVGAVVWVYERHTRAHPDVWLTNHEPTTWSDEKGNQP